MFYNGDIGSGKLPLNLKAMKGHKMTSPNSEYFFEEESDHISRNEQQEINADRDALDDAPFLLIPLTQGQFAKVSPHRFEELNKFKWFAWWCECTKSYYARRNIPLADGRQRTLGMHRVILGLEYGNNRQGDHENHDTLDNRDNNLRISTHMQNQWNRRRYKENFGKIRGIVWAKDCRKWRAQISIKGKTTHLGLFESKEDAHRAYCAAAIKYRGEYAFTS